MAPTLMAVGMITFVGAARNIANIALLSTTANRPLAILQLDYIAQKKLEEAVVIASIIMLISLAGALAAMSWACAATSAERNKGSRVRDLAHSMTVGGAGRETWRTG
jgi:ABC-type Fe3+ transport system permease subunit